MKKRADALIVAAGRGERAGLEIPKQFYKINGKPVLFYAIDTFCQCDIIDKIAVALPYDDFEKYADYMREFNFKNVTYVRGGKTRMESVYNGLTAIEKLSNSGIVCIHDGVRPFVTQKIIYDSVDCAEKYNAAVAAVKITDTVKIIENGVVKDTCDRSRLYAAQTPQTFKLDIIKNAYDKAVTESKDFTDDCAVAEHYGISVHIVEGSVKNIKLTLKEDFEGL